MIPGFVFKCRYRPGENRGEVTLLKTTHAMSNLPFSMEVVPAVISFLSLQRGAQLFNIVLRNHAQ